MERHSGKILIIIGALFFSLITFSVGYLVRDFDIVDISFSPNSCGI